MGIFNFLFRNRRISENRSILLSPENIHRAAEKVKNCGNDHFFQGDLDQAEECYREAARILPSYAEAYVNLGYVYNEYRRYEEAIFFFKKAIDLKPSLWHPYMELAKSLLLNADIENGFIKLENAFDIQHKMSEDFRYLKGGTIEHFLMKKFMREGDLKDIRGKTILVCTECGLGDNIMMFRFLDILKEQYHLKKILVLCEQPLARIVKNISSVDSVVLASGNIVDNDFDYHCSTLSLPYITRTNAKNIPNNPYFLLPKECKEKWEARLAELNGIKIGLAWGGNRALIQDKLRSIPLKKFKPLFDIPGITWVSLQQGEPLSQLIENPFPIVNWSDEIIDMQDTAALANSLDLIIAVDTSVIHLAGALGCTAWLLNRYGSEWRWLKDEEVSPWYPNVRIFTQRAFNDWDSVIEKVASELRVWIASQSSICSKK